MIMKNQRDFDCAATFKVGDPVTLANITYLIEDICTVADHRAAGRERLALLMERNRCVADLICRRPQGRKQHLLRAFNSASGTTFLFRHILSL